ncbi:zinc finger protein-domain-containing protein [Annulohypoxylon maeteangense]|uniref:zinc finger protein-domain-containing protein n=1 Tax=Annulohypoxylon maeteangense TaxID=1927788 RepID=UPI002007F072|nr:zinc finger protein-domain-containing protein [Annulohypoxylon maeteangense]KAI0880391.1 zinc finger protein-domain-containing protein [Annulohypoxylon maeteangense]
MTPPASSMEIDNDRDPEFKNMLKKVLHLSLDDSIHSPSSKVDGQETTPSAQSFKQIGEGGCSAVFTLKGRSLAIKISKESRFGQWNDYVMHTLIYEEIKRRTVDVMVPRCYFFVPAEDLTFFDKNPGLVEAARRVCDIPTDILVSERIPPLDDETRTALINQYCAPRLRLRAVADPKNNDCLVKIYLGSMEGKIGETPFSLRNFELHLNQMIDMGLDVDSMASRVGQALAVMHWAASVDAWGVQFVLGGSSKPSPLRYLDIEEMEPSTYTGPKSRVIEHFLCRRTVLWMLNFDQVQPITMDFAGVSQAVQAAVFGSVYLPKRYSRNATQKRVWDSFSDQYVKTSNIILQCEDRKSQQLPRSFLDQLNKLELRKKSTWTED